LQWWDRLITSKGDEGNRVNSPPSEYSQGAHLKNSIQPVLVVNDVPDPPFPFPPPDAIRVIPENTDGGTPLQVVPINPSDPHTPLKVQGSLAAVQQARLFAQIAGIAVAANGTTRVNPYDSNVAAFSTFLNVVDELATLRRIWILDRQLDGRGAGDWRVVPTWNLLTPNPRPTITPLGIGLDLITLDPEQADYNPRWDSGYNLDVNIPVQIKPSEGSGNRFLLQLTIVNGFQEAAQITVGVELICYPPGLSPYSQLRHIVLSP